MILACVSRSQRALRRTAILPGRQTNTRTAFSLLEVIIAMAIFMGAILVLGAIMNNAGDLALDVQLQDQANLRCAGKLAEVVVGAEAMSSSESFTAFSNAEDGWQWRMTSSEVTGVTGLYDVTIFVRYEKGPKLIESRLAQMVLDPAKRGSTLDRTTTTTTTTTGVMP